MDFDFFIVTIIEVLLGTLVTILLTRLYLKNRYTPTLLLATFFGLLTVAFTVTLPIFFLPGFGLEPPLAVEVLQNASVILLFLMFPFLIIAFEGMKGDLFSTVSIMFIAFTAFSIGFLATIPPRWSWISDPEGIWYQVTNLEFDILFVAYLLTAVTIVLYRLTQFVTEKETGRSKTMPIIALAGFFAGVLGTIAMYLLEIPNLDYLMVIIGLSIMATVYILSPKSFFLSSTRISSIMVINNNNNIPFLTIAGSEASNVDLAAAGLGGVMMLLQEILKSDRPPTFFYDGNKGVLMEHDLKNGISGVVVADHINNILRAPLRYSVSLFQKKFAGELEDWRGDVSAFQTFKETLLDIFDFAWFESKPVD